MCVGLNQLYFGNGVIAPSLKNHLKYTIHEQEVNDVRNFLENLAECRWKCLLNYFDLSCTKPGEDPNKCCDICAKNIR